MMPNLRNYKKKKFNTQDIKCRVLTTIINDKVETKVGTKIKIVVGKRGGVEIGELGIWKKIDICLPMIVHD